MSRACSCPAAGCQGHKDTAPHRLPRLSWYSSLSLGKAKASVRAGEGDGATSIPQQRGCTVSYLLPTRATCPRETHGALLSLFTPCALQAETQISTGQEGELQPLHGHSTAVVTSKARSGRSPCTMSLLAAAHRAQGCHHALLPLPLALSIALHDPQPSSSQPCTSFPQPCTFSPSMPCSPLSPLSPSVPFRPRSPCRRGNTGRGQGMRRSSGTHRDGEDRLPGRRKMGVCRVAEEEGRICSAREGTPAGKALPRGTGRMGRVRLDSSYRLPLAAPCSRWPLHHHSVTLYTQSRQRWG